MLTESLLIFDTTLKNLAHNHYSNLNFSLVLSWNSWKVVPFEVVALQWTFNSKFELLYGVKLHQTFWQNKQININIIWNTHTLELWIRDRNRWRPSQWGYFNLFISSWKKKPEQIQAWTGIEPTTYAIPVQRSNQLSYQANWELVNWESIFIP